MSKVQVICQQVRFQGHFFITTLLRWKIWRICGSTALKSLSHSLLWTSKSTKNFILKMKVKSCVKRLDSKGWKDWKSLESRDCMWTGFSSSNCWCNKSTNIVTLMLILLRILTKYHFSVGVNCQACRELNIEVVYNGEPFRNNQGPNTKSKWYMRDDIIPHATWIMSLRSL